MKIFIEIDVDLVGVPLEPRCEKCAVSIEGVCVARQSIKTCNYGRNGYFVRNNIKEAQDGQHTTGN